MLNKEQATSIKELIESNDNIIFFHHVNPDGDCMASTFGFAKALMNNYPNKNIKVVADVEDYTPHLRYMDKYIDWDNTITKPEHDDYLAIISDTSALHRVRFYEEFKDNINKTIVIDHHENGLSIPNVNEFWKEPDYPASALMIFELMREMELPISSEPAIVIAHGILTDTRSFMMANGKDIVFEYFASLMNIFGEDKYNELVSAMLTKTEQDIKFQSWVYGSYIKEDNVAYLTITKEDLDRFNYKPSQGAKVDLLMGIEGIEYWMFFIQYEDHVRVEFRSSSEEKRVDLAATHFGGGGHKQRSGCQLQSMEQHKDVVEYIIKNK